MDTALVDLGSVGVVPSFTRAMKGYIALSRVKKADDLLLAQPFSPALFRQGKQPWATLLLASLRGELPEAELKARAKEQEQRLETPTLLRAMTWTCERRPNNTYHR